MIKISVVIVNYNSGFFLERCVESVLRSNYPVEIVVVDNASKDRSTEFLGLLSSSEFSLKVVRNSINLGFSGAVNIGVENSTGQHILLLNPDCLVLRHTIKFLSKLLDENVEVGIVGGLVFDFEGSEQRGCRRREPTLRRSIVKVLRGRGANLGAAEIDLTNQPLPSEQISVDAVSGSFLLIRRVLFNSLGGMDERFFLHFEDFDLCRRVRNAGWKILFAPDISIFHYQGGSSVARDTLTILWHKHWGMQRYQRKHYGRHLGVDALILLLVWGHFVLQMMGYMRFLGRRKSLCEKKGLSGGGKAFPWMAVLPRNDSKQRLLVLGQVDVVGQAFLRLGVLKGWSVYIEGNVENGFENEGIYRMSSEYLGKVPERDAPEFKSLVSFDQIPHSGEANGILKKLRVQRLAIVNFSDRSREMVHTENNTLQGKDTSHAVDEWGNRLLSIPNYEVREFSVGLSATVLLTGPTKYCFEELAEQCYSWLAE